MKGMTVNEKVYWGFDADIWKWLEVAMLVLRGGTHIEKDEEERSARAGTYLGMRDEGCWDWRTYSESNRSNFETNSVANREPVQIRKNWCDVAEPKFLCDNSSKSILDTLKASQIWNGCASQELTTPWNVRHESCLFVYFRDTCHANTGSIYYTVKAVKLYIRRFVNVDTRARLSIRWETHQWR